MPAGQNRKRLCRMDSRGGHGGGRFFMRLEDSILIHCSSHDLYDLIKDVERHVELLPGYTKSQIVERKNDSCIVQREAIMAEQIRRWKSEVWMDEDKGMRFRQVEGPL